MSKIHFIPVKHGDAFVIECDRGDNHGIVVVDGGPTGYGYMLQNELKELGVPDLLVLTHYDDDHIGGLTQYVKAAEMEGQMPAKEVWANCTGWAPVQADPPEPVMTRSARQGVNLSLLLQRCVDAFGIEWKADVFEGYRKDFPFASIDVFSPTEEVMGKALEAQVSVAKVAMRSMKVEINELEIPLEVLAQEVPKAPNTKVSGELANAASIGFLLRCDGLAILMLGDCYPHNVEAYLRAQGYSEENPLVVDYVKVAHHGSRNNTSNSLLDIIRCNRFLISTDGDKFNHPERTTLAHILCHPCRPQDETVHLYFDYPYDQVVANRGAFLNDGELEKWNAVVHDNATEIVPEPVVAVAPAGPTYSVVELKSLKNSQVNDLLELMRELNPDIPVTSKMLRRAAKLAATHLFAAVDCDGRILGCATLCPYESPTGRKASVEDVVVTSAFRSQGIGRALMEHLLDYARKNLAPVDLSLTSSPWRTEANELYASLGFVQRETNAYRMTCDGGANLAVPLI